MHVFGLCGRKLVHLERSCMHKRRRASLPQKSLQWDSNLRQSSCEVTALTSVGPHHFLLVLLFFLFFLPLLLFLLPANIMISLRKHKS